jgi:hypothetical protein
MFLLDKKANDIMSKIEFAKEIVMKVESPDNVLQTYIEPFMSWLDILRKRVERAKLNFEEFLRDTGFVEGSYLREESQRRLLTVILRDFEDIERRIYISVDTFLPLILFWNSQKSRGETKRQHKLLMCFILDLLQLCRLSESMMAIIGEDYACLPLEWGKVRKHIVFGIYSEIQNLRKWVLLAHELGHAYYDQNYEKINSYVTPQVIRRLVENRPPALDPRDFESIVYTWAQHWIPEFVADCFAVKTLGPAFVAQFMVAALDSQPDRIEATHPPPNLRMRFMMKILDSLCLSDINVNSYRKMWRSYAHTISRPGSLFIVHDDVVEAALEGIDLIVNEKPIEKKWDEVLEAKEALSLASIPNQDLISIISALAISEPNLDYLSLYETLLKRYASNSYIP